MEYRKLVEEVAHEAIKAGRDPSSIQIVVVTKGRSWNQIQPFYDLGVRNFAESRLQDALPKIESAPKDIIWHYIGNLQKKHHIILPCAKYAHPIYLQSSPIQL